MADVVIWIRVDEHEVTAHTAAYHLRHWHGDHVEEEQLIACESAPLSGLMYKIIHHRAYKMRLGRAFASRHRIPSISAMDAVRIQMQAVGGTED